MKKVIFLLMMLLGMSGTITRLWAQGNAQISEMELLIISGVQDVIIKNGFIKESDTLIIIRDQEIIYDSVAVRLLKGKSERIYKIIDNGKGVVLIWTDTPNDIDKSTAYFFVLKKILTKAGDFAGAVDGGYAMNVELLRRKARLGYEPPEVLYKCIVPAPQK